jgi:hypothetical protein
MSRIKKMPDLLDGVSERDFVDLSEGATQGGHFAKQRISHLGQTDVHGPERRRNRRMLVSPGRDSERSPDSRRDHSSSSVSDTLVVARERIRVRVSAYAYDAEPRGRRMRVDYVTRPAHRFESVTVDEARDEVCVTIIVTSPRGPTRASGHLRSLTVDLIEPLGDRRVVAGGSGRVLERISSPMHPPFQPGGPET